MSMSNYDYEITRSNGSVLKFSFTARTEKVAREKANLMAKMQNGKARLVHRSDIPHKTEDEKTNKLLEAMYFNDK